MPRDIIPAKSKWKAENEFIRLKIETRQRAIPPIKLTYLASLRVFTPQHY